MRAFLLLTTFDLEKIPEQIKKLKRSTVDCREMFLTIHSLLEVWKLMKYGINHRGRLKGRRSLSYIEKLWKC
jgi:hypothetical protein